MNPRYLAYCAAHGFRGDPDGMLAHDRERWPGGVMCGFVTWMAPLIGAFEKLRGPHAASAYPDDFTAFVWEQAS